MPGGGGCEEYVLARMANAAEVFAGIDLVTSDGLAHNRSAGCVDNLVARASWLDCLKNLDMAGNAGWRKCGTTGVVCTDKGN